jgi:hypothetical protein
METRFNYVITVHFSDGCEEDFESLAAAIEAVSEYECRDGEEQTPVTVDYISAQPLLTFCENDFESIRALIEKFESILFDF